jgi:hypothetical protein
VVCNHGVRGSNPLISIRRWPGLREHSGRLPVEFGRSNDTLGRKRAAIAQTNCGEQLTGESGPETVRRLAETPIAL